MTRNSLNIITALVLTILFSTIVNATSLQQVGIVVALNHRVMKVRIPFQLDKYDYSDEELETYYERDKRQLNSGFNDQESTTEEFLVEDPKGWGLAHVLGMRILLFWDPNKFLSIVGIASLVCLVIYIIGITYKLIKMHLGTYVREDPVFLRYK